MTEYELLSEPIKKYIRDKRWSSFRPIQAAAIERILNTNLNYILASRTASGKTEAAFLPILSKIDFKEAGVQVLYISPLIALINDQFNRIEELCKYLDIKVTKWHGEANKSLKNKLLKSPEGIVLITPESIEAMFINSPYNIKLLFSNLKYIVIDEIHSFLGTDRGYHLKSLISRLQSENQTPFNVIGLSATIGDYYEAKRFTGNEENTKVILDKRKKDTEVHFEYYKSETSNLPLDLLKELYLRTKDSKALIFPNSRGRAEEISIKLKKIAERLKGHTNYFSHHSSVDKEIREYVEYFAKHNVRKNFSISCTSTLELGIDIGSVDLIVQIDSTFSISSLIQRLGRSGRKDSEKSTLWLYTTDKWSLLQSLACWLLYSVGYIEQLEADSRPYDILAHQILSIAKTKSGIDTSVLVDKLKRNFAFSKISEEDILIIIKHLTEKIYLEKLHNEIILGTEGEKIVERRDFYSMFKSENNFRVIFSKNTIGEIPYSPQIIENENIFLAAKIWKITHVDIKSKRIEVISANDGKSPIFFGSGFNIHSRIREKMFEIILSKDQYDFLDEKSNDEIGIIRNDFSSFEINDLCTDRPLFIKHNGLELYTFTSTRINRTLALLLKASGLQIAINENNSVIQIHTTRDDFIDKWNILTRCFEKIDSIVEIELEQFPHILDFSKWCFLLPQKYKISLLENKYYDFEGALKFISNIRFVENRV